MNVRSGSNVSEIEENIKEAESKIHDLKYSLSQWEDDLNIMKQEYEESKWMKTEHPKEFNGLYISSNLGSWEQVKELEMIDNPFYIHAKDNGTSLSIEDAKELIKYLQQKIDYLEEK